MNNKGNIEALITKEFLSKISHHTRSPFNGLLGFSELLLLHQHKLSPEDTTSYLQRVNMLAKKAFISADNMILFLKITTSNIQIQSTVVPFSSVIDHAYNLNKEGLILKNIDFVTEIEPNLTLSTDSLHLNSLLSNMFLKALKLCNDDSKISVLAKNIGNKAFISVNYTGMEVESEIVRHFFASGKKDEKIELFAPELDIELWICHQLANLLNMNFSVNFSKSKGTTFTLES